MDYAYPPQLALYLRQQWEGAPGVPPLMDAAQLERVLTVAYQASLLREEDRPVRVRIAVADPETLDALDGPPHGLQPLVFEQPVPFTPHELRRLASAAKYHRALVGVRPDDDGRRLVVWGVLQSGPGWIQVAQGARGPAPVPPAWALVVRVIGPGRLAVGRGATTLAELRGGVVGGPGLDVFRSKWLSMRFADARAELMAAHGQARVQAESAGERWAELGPDVYKLVSQAMVRRLVTATVAAHHGGTVVFLPPEQAEPAVHGTGPLHMKYAFRDGEARRRYRRIILSWMRAIARAGGSAGTTRVDGETYDGLHDPELHTLRDAIFEMSQLVAALTEVDGAVVMTKRYELLGFGAEIAGGLPDVQNVARALDLEGEDTLPEPLVADGTRHRSAYRLCSLFPDALAVVISQDGGVRFVTTHRGAVTFWEHAVEALDV
jgi:hypothetical protein